MTNKYGNFYSLLLFLVIAVSVSGRRNHPLQPPSTLAQLPRGRESLDTTRFSRQEEVESQLLQQQGNGESTQQDLSRLRAGGSQTKKGKSTPSSPTSISKKSAIQWTLTLSSLTALGVYAYSTRESWSPLLLDKKKLQQAAVDILEGLRPADPNDATQRYRAYALYASGMTTWEMLGLSTIPVETAAGMVFGWPAAVASATGKLMGASLAFWFGRSVLQKVVLRQFADNAMLQLLRENSAERHHPLLSALMMKFSCFPETIKNYGTAAFLPSVNFITFFGATFFHGVMFTLLWTWLGVETSQQLEAEAANSLGLQIALGAMLVMGFVVSPVSMAWWIRDLRKADEPKPKKIAFWKRINSKSNKKKN